MTTCLIKLFIQNLQATTQYDLKLNFNRYFKADKDAETYLYMGTREGRGAQGFLSFIHHFSFWYAQYEGCLISSGSHRCYPETTLPTPMDPFAWIQKVKLHDLVPVKQQSRGEI